MSSFLYEPWCVCVHARMCVCARKLMMSSVLSLAEDETYEEVVVGLPAGRHDDGKLYDSQSSTNFAFR